MDETIVFFLFFEGEEEEWGGGLGVDYIGGREGGGWVCFVTAKLLEIEYQGGREVRECVPVWVGVSETSSRKKQKEKKMEIC